MRRKLIIAVCLIPVLLLALAAGGLAVFYPTLKVGASYKAITVCAGTFLAGRDSAEVDRNDVGFFPMSLLTAVPDDEQKTVTASFFGLAPATAVFRPGCGCALANGVTPEELREQVTELKVRPTPDMSGVIWPMGDRMPDTPSGVKVDQAVIDAALDDAFSEPDPASARGTRAIVVVHKDRIIAERYAPGFDAKTPLIGWSMSKSVTSTLVGVLVEQERLDIHAPAPVPEWKGEGDPRGAITTDQLLRMSSGLSFTEVYDDYGSDVVTMLYRSSDAGAYAASRPAAHEPDAVWYYSSGTTNIVSRIVRRTAGGTPVDNFTFAREHLFDRIGMFSAVIEADPSGTSVGSSLMYATARDWARYGLLYLNDGVWQGERILPEGWVKYSITPTAKAPKGMYGAHWWLNRGTKEKPDDLPWPELPAEAYAARGYETQRVIVIPSREMVVVRLGLSRPESAFNTEAFAAEMLRAVGAD